VPARSGCWRSATGADLLPDPVGALVGQASGPPSLELAIPQTGMNDCGPVVRALVDRLD